jgi:hypothetical protein
VGPLLAVPEPTADELKENRALLDELRKRPEKLTRLRRDLKSLQALPEARREQILHFDRDLHDESSSAHLRDVADRFGQWIESQSESDREAILNAPTKAARLTLIQELRDREWMGRQPKALQLQWLALKPAERSALARKLREEERARHQDWQFAVRFWTSLVEKQPLPARLADFKPNVQTLVNEYLWPMLSKEEKERLKKAEGRWPAYPQALVEIADQHPFALPSSDGPRTTKELPKAVRDRVAVVKGKDLHNRLKAAEGKWPDFAVAVIELNDRRAPYSPLPNELWARGPRDLLRPMQKYLENVLLPVLTDDEQRRLSKAEGKWPEYPQTLQKVAEAHDVDGPPWQTALPDPQEQWASYRALDPNDLPEVPRQVLHDFAMYKLKPEERAKLNLSPTDHVSGLKALEKEFWEHYRQEPQKYKGGNLRVEPTKRGFKGIPFSPPGSGPGSQFHER